MRAYCITYDITKRSSKTVYVSKNSTFQIGLKILNVTGTPFDSVKLLDSTGSAVAPQASKLAQYTLYALTSGDAEGAKQYTPQVTVVSELGPRNINLPPLTIVTTSSDVAEIQPKEDLSAYWNKDETEEHQLSGTYEDGSEFSLTAICKKA